VVIRLLARFFASWSTPAILRAGNFLGAIWFHVIRVRRGVAESAVARAFPEKSRAEVRTVVKANFQHLMISLLESVAYIAYPDARLRELIGMEGVEESVLQPRAAGKGVVAISAHIGNFEMCTDGCGLINELPMIIVARIPKGGIARAMLDAFRGRNVRMEVFEPKGSAPKVLASFRDKRSVLAFVIDQNLRRGRGIFLPFLGEIANTTTGFASLQRKGGTALCVVLMHREPDGTHRVRVKPVTPSDHPNQRVAMINDTLTMSNHIESFVRARPEQWFWVHRRWKARPEPGDLVRTNAGLERFGRGRIAAFLGDASDVEAVRWLRDAGIAVFVVGTDVEAKDVPARIADQRLDAASSLFWRTPGVLAEERTGELRDVVTGFLERTVSAQKDEPS
jgi:Kdo2-lipid IVA lauroyltransferase/acyltransferase